MLLIGKNRFKRRVQLPRLLQKNTKGISEGKDRNKTLEDPISVYLYMEVQSGLVQPWKVSALESNAAVLKFPNST